MWSPLCSILVCKIPQFLVKTYRFGQLIIHFQKVDTLRLLKIYIMFCPPARAKYPFFQAPAHRLNCFKLPIYRNPKNTSAKNLILRGITLQNCRAIKNRIGLLIFCKNFGLRTRHQFFQDSYLQSILSCSNKFTLLRRGFTVSQVSRDD